MALWGRKDGAPFGALTATVAANPGLNLLTFSDSIASYNVEPGNTIIVDTAGTPQFVRVNRIISETTIETTTNMTAVAGVDCELQQSPKYTSMKDVSAGNIVAADLSEVKAGGAATPGWLRKITKTRDGQTYTIYETLVSASSIIEDVVNEEFANIASPAPPATFVFNSQPQDQTFDAANTPVSTYDENDVAAVFSFSYTYNGSGQDQIQWQVSKYDEGVTWADINNVSVLPWYNPADNSDYTLLRQGTGTQFPASHSYDVNNPTDPGSLTYGLWNYRGTDVQKINPDMKFRVKLTDGVETFYSDPATLTIT